MDLGSELAKIMAGALLGYFTGRATKNRDIMQAEAKPDLNSGSGVRSLAFDIPHKEGLRNN
jgi:hypothetical protein